MSFEIIVWIVVFFAAVVLLNLLILKYIIRKALTQYIKPELQNKNCTFVNYRWLGFLDKGNFKSDKLQVIPDSGMGRATIIIYVDVFYLQDSEQRKTTIKIETFLTKIISVDFNHSLY